MAPTVKTVVSIATLVIEGTPFGSATKDYLVLEKSKALLVLSSIRCRFSKLLRTMEDPDIWKTAGLRLQLKTDEWT